MAPYFKSILRGQNQDFTMYPNQPHAEGVPYQLLGLKVKIWLNGGHLKNPTEIPQKFQKNYEI